MPRYSAASSNEAGGAVARKGSVQEVTLIDIFMGSSDTVAHRPLRRTGVAVITHSLLLGA